MFLVVFGCILQSCAQQEEIPKELQFSFEYLTEKLDTAAIEKFKSDSTTVVEYHFSVGRYLRNTLLRHHKKSDELIGFFNALGIRHKDDMSSIILTSYKRYLNKKDIELQPQVDKYIAYWKPIIECDKKLTKNAVRIFDNYKLQDTIRIRMPVSEDSNSVVDYGCPNLDWEFEATKDLVVEGIITNRYFINKVENVFFKVKVLTKNHLTTKIMMEEVNVGDEFEFGLETAWKIEPVN